MQPEVSVVISVRNVEKHISKCVEALLDQSFRDFEIVLVDDASEDNTTKIIKSFDDKRIKVVRNMKHSGIAKSRNRGLKICSGKFVFFTDGDCIVSRDWLKQGLQSLQNPGFIGVEGRICYVYEGYSPTFSDHCCENKCGGQFMTGNVAYRKKDIESVGGFDERYSYLEDRDLALRLLKRGRIVFNPDMVIYDQKQIVTPFELLRSASHTKGRVILFKRFGDKECIVGRVVNPLNLVKILFPPLILGGLLLHDFKTSEDFRLLPFTYIQAILERLQLWKTCATERVFLI
jgi:glycosyltransferase involved in cell wall biosynthesis